MSCLNTNTLEYQTLKNLSGTSKFNLESTIKYYLENYNRYPELDEIPRVNSRPSLELYLGIKKYKNLDYVKTEDLLNYTGSNSVETAIQILNNKFKDLEINYTDLEDEVLLNIINRPSLLGTTFLEDYVADKDTSKLKSRSIFLKNLNKFKQLYGINIIDINNDELNTNSWQTKVPNVKNASAFVYNGDIYVNTDIASIDSPIHELLHIFLGSMRYTDPEVYFNLVQQVSSLVNLNLLSLLYINRANSDILEEIFVQEFANFLVGKESAITKLGDAEISKIFYNINRTLDTFLMGNFSVRALPNKKIINSSILSLAESVQSDIINTKYLDILDYANLHRKVANIKESLIKQGKLIEYCS